MELLMTVFLALIVYLLISKLVSLMSTDGGVVEDVKVDRAFKVASIKRKKRVRFASAAAGDAVVYKVDKLRGESSYVENSDGTSDGGVIVVEERELGLVVEEKDEDVTSGIGGLVGDETCMDDDVVNCEQGVKFVSGDPSDYVRVVEVGEDRRSEIERELYLNEDVGGERVVEVGQDRQSEIERELYLSEDVGGEMLVKIDDQSEDIEDHISEIERQVTKMQNVESEIVQESDARAGSVGILEIGEDQGSEITRELVNGNESVERKEVVDLDDQSKEGRIMELGGDEGNEIAKELNGDGIVNELNEQKRLVNNQTENGSELEAELDRNEKEGNQIGMTLATDVILDDQIEHGKIKETGEIGEDLQTRIQSELNEGDDDWEGIEKSELEKVFATAANYAKDDDKLMNLGSDVQMQLYGLHKIAMEGPCHEAQPMALKVSARAKWNAWQKLGNMSPEAAMEQYIDLLSDRLPGWLQNDNSTEDGEVDSKGAAMPGVADPHTTTLDNISEKEKKVELISCSDGGVHADRLSSVNEDEE